MLGILATEFKVTVSTATGTQADCYVCNFFFLIWLLVLCQILLHEHPVLVPPEHLPPLPLANCPLAPLLAPTFLPSPPAPAAGGAVHRAPLIHRVRSSPKPSVCFQLPQTQEEAAPL